MIAKSNWLPLLGKPWQPGAAGQQLLRRRLLNVSLLGDESVESVDETVCVIKGLSDGFLLVFFRRPGQLQVLKPLAAQVGDGRSLKSNLREHAGVLTPAEQLAGERSVCTRFCSKAEKLILDGARLGVLTAVHRTPADQFEA